MGISPTSDLDVAKDARRVRVLDRIYNELNDHQADVHGPPRGDIAAQLAGKVQHNRVGLDHGTNDFADHLLKIRANINRQVGGRV